MPEDRVTGAPDPPLRCRLFGHDWLTWTGYRYERIDWFTTTRSWMQKCKRCPATRIKP